MKSDRKLLVLIMFFVLIGCSAILGITEIPWNELFGAITEKGEIRGKQSGEFKVVSVVDGDTIEIDYNGSLEKVRLIGIDAPESHECFSKEATNKLKSLIEGKEVRLEFDPTQGERDRYGRLLLYVWQGDVFVNETMIEEGYAYEYTYNLPYKYQGSFMSAERDARKNKRGLWGDICN